MPRAAMICLLLIIGGCATARDSTSKYYLQPKHNRTADPAPERISLTEVENQYASEYHDAIKKTANWFVKDDDDPADWFVIAKKENDSQILVSMSHIDGIKKVEAFQKEGRYLLGNASGRDGRCVYDLDKKEILECGIWQ